MAEMNNFAEISENFDTIKTLLNSIRAQGILNTSDVDKLLTGINAKLEKINTDEDIDLIKIFLSELKQNFEERHGVLISKFGAIESLFSNLLKNSSEMLKSTEVKELFDIVATNLSVFSREVISQKESLTDISLRLDALRSDDSQKKDIIKNIAVLKSDIERINNGFDTIVISLNDNFKSLAKTITSLDKTDYLDKFSNNLASIEISSNTVLSALQMLDRKTEKVEEALLNLATKDELASASKRIVDLTAQDQELVQAVSDLALKTNRFDSLAEKIDASVNVIASLKAVLEEADNKNTQIVLEQLTNLAAEIKEASNEDAFNELKQKIETVMQNVVDTCSNSQNCILLTQDQLTKLTATIDALDIKTNLHQIVELITSNEKNIVDNIESSINKVITLQDANITRILNDISSSSDSFGSRLNQSQNEIAVLCQKNFTSVLDSVKDLRTLLAQIDENSVSANNAIFSSITDRLTVFENSLKTSLENQERTVNLSSAQLVEHVENIKNISGVLDYKMDSSILEAGNLKRELESLKKSVEDVIALDFVNVVKDLRVDLYASKQELANNIENSSSDLSEKFTDDIYGKYELLISKLDSLEDEFKKTQISSLDSIKSVLDNISSSIVDVISYVSENQSKTNTDELDTKLSALVNFIQENSLNYIDGVRDVVDIIRVQVENNVKALEEDVNRSFEGLGTTIEKNSEEIRTDLKCSYSKLLEIQDLYKEIKSLIDLNGTDNLEKYESILTSASALKSDFEQKVLSLKNSLLDKITEFKQEFTCENAEKTSELKFTVENLHSNASSKMIELFDETKDLFNKISTENSNARTASLAKLLDNFVSLKELISRLSDTASEELNEKINILSEDLALVKASLETIDENIDGDFTRQLSILEGNFEALVSQISILFDKSDLALSEKIKKEFDNISIEIGDSLSEKLEGYKLKIEDSFDALTKKTLEQSDYLKERINDFDAELKSAWEKQAEDCESRIQDIADELKVIIDENIKLTAVDYVALKNKLNDFARDIAQNNQNLTEGLRAQLDDITKYIDSVLDLQAQDNSARNEEFNTKFEETFAKIVDQGCVLTNAIKEELLKISSKTDVELLKGLIDRNNVGINELINSLPNSDIKEIIRVVVENNVNINELLNLSVKEEIKEVLLLLKDASDSTAEWKVVVGDKFDEMSQLTLNSSETTVQSVNSAVNRVFEQLEAQRSNIQSYKDLIISSIEKTVSSVSSNVEKETDIIVAEIVEQFDILKKSQADEVINLTSRIEELVNAHIYNNIEDLKSYLDIKTDNSVMVAKLDNLKLELSTSLESALSGISKLLSSDSFTSAMSDYKLANELLVNSAADRLNDSLQAFVKTNQDELLVLVADNKNLINDRFNLFDKTFVDALTDKFEEIKLISNRYNDSFDSLQHSISDVLTNFEQSKLGIEAKIESLQDSLQKALSAAANSVNDELTSLNKCFENLRSQISNKSFDEAFQASINKQIDALASMVEEQLTYVEDINDLCSNNLPEVAELNTIVKHSIMTKVNDISEKIDSMVSDDSIENELKAVKSDIITQFIDIFNQVSFAVEQEEILDFIQEKHDELITVLSHIVTSNEELAGVDSKVESIKDEIGSINEKINSIISSEGDIDYIYSLQDLESDIANLRLALNDIKENAHNTEFEELINSTNEIYDLVEAFKSDLPTKQDFESIAEDIVSISSRTNKLILASDESYKTLQDNLQDFKLVINDLDERTRNFAQESGMDRIDSKLNALNTMVMNGAKTNQVFNQVFEYLAEWVDKASVQINSISDKVETLDDIGQIKVMLADLKAGAEDNSDSVELVEALGSVFDKQAKKINNLETKLDKIIVETTINNKNNKLDLSPMEDTLNKFLVAVDEKMSAQQEKINSLESKLQEVMGLLADKETAQLTKKVGGMDRQIAKLNKSIEKIASHVIEK